MRSIESIGRKVLHIIKSYAPVDRGNLRNNAIKGETTGTQEYTLSIDTRVAPYAQYTIRPWSETSPLIWRSEKHPEWNGKHHSFLYNHKGWDPTTPKQNPNEGWLGRAVLAAVKDIAEKGDGTYTIERN